MRRQESLQPADPLDFRQLLRHALLEQPIPTRQLLGLRLELLGLQLHRIVKLLDPQQRADAGHQGRVLERLGEVVVTAGFETVDDVAGVGLGGDQNDRHEAKRYVLLELLENRDAVELRHHDIEKDEVGLELARARQPGLTVHRREYFVAKRAEPNPKQLHVGRVVVDNENSRGSSQAAGPFQRHMRNSRTLARMTRGLKGLAKYPSHPAAIAFASSPDKA